MKISDITIVTRPVKDGRLSLHLHFSPAVRHPETMRNISNEPLGIYIWERPANIAQQQHNEEMLIKAEGIRSVRVQSLINEEYGFLDRNKENGDFVEYFRRKSIKSGTKSYMAFRHFEKFCEGKCKFRDLTRKFCDRYMEYLATEARTLKPRYELLATNTAAAYFSAFKLTLRQAYQERIIREDVADLLGNIPKRDTRKEFLTLDEVKQLAATPCQHEVLKRVALFSCLTGLRISDILKLRWEEIERASDGGWWMRICTEKTETEATLPISDEALELCGEVQGEGVVFVGLRRCMIQHPLHAWIKAAGIRKHITFHCFRHTFATLQIALGTDIYTVSKMLTHKSVKPTQIYADLVNSKKRESANRISLK